MTIHHCIGKSLNVYLLYTPSVLPSTALSGSPPHPVDDCVTEVILRATLTRAESKD